MALGLVPPARTVTKVPDDDKNLSTYNALSQILTSMKSVSQVIDEME